jgi:RNA polymerase sigma factor (sigma-70 family)
MDKTAGRWGYDAAVYSPVTREGEVELARRFEEGEFLILEALLVSGIDARAVLLGGETDIDDREDRDDIDDSEGQRGLTPHRFEAVSAYVACLEHVKCSDLPRAERRRLLRPLISHWDLTRKLLKAWRERRIAGEASIADARLRVGIAMSEGARQELLLANLPIVARNAKKFLGRGLAFHDLMQEGYIGLMRAIEKFDYRLGHRFVVYAAWWIRATMWKALADAKEIRIPLHVVEMRRKIQLERSRLTERDGTGPDAALIATHLGITKETLSRIADVVKQPVSLEQPREAGDRQGLPIGATIADTSLPPPDEVAAINEISKRAMQMLDRLKPREQEMIRLRFGIGTARDHTLQEVGDRFGLSRERVRQIERAALKKLRIACEEATEGTGRAKAFSTDERLTS